MQCNTSCVSQLPISVWFPAGLCHFTPSKVTRNIFVFSSHVISHVAFFIVAFRVWAKPICQLSTLETDGSISSEESASFYCEITHCVSTSLLMKKSPTDLSSYCWSLVLVYCLTLASLQRKHISYVQSHVKRAGLHVKHTLHIGTVVLEHFCGIMCKAPNVSIPLWKLWD